MLMRDSEFAFDLKICGIYSLSILNRPDLASLPAGKANCYVQGANRPNRYYAPSLALSKTRSYKPAWIPSRGHSLPSRDPDLLSRTYGGHMLVLGDRAVIMDDAHHHDVASGGEPHFHEGGGERR